MLYTFWRRMGKVEGGVEQDDVKMEKNTTVQYMYTMISYT